MRPDSRALLLSIRPRFAELIFNGEKTVELRRVRPAVKEGDLVLLYVSSPTCELIGTCTVAGLDVGSISALWKLHGKNAGVTHVEFNTYFAGAALAVGISIKNPRRVHPPRTLAELRSRLPGFSPPQSFSYLSEDKVESLDIRFELATRNRDDPRPKVGLVRCPNCRGQGSRAMSTCGNNCAVGYKCEKAPDDKWHS